ncbi:MAG: hypothetical protein KC729_21415, partial [Candidatus Eisenbacteria bacterium]|nr:hypothetical protein [Candidatus Eisenbacteria bacterium]
DEVSYNTWYDGPFDQLPDAYVKNGQIDMKEYIVAHTGLNPDVMDRYGSLVHIPGTRVPIAPYRMYRDPAELSFVSELVARLEDPTSGMSRSDFYSELTREEGRNLLEELGEHAAVDAEGTDEENGSTGDTGAGETRDGHSPAGPGGE